MCAPSNFKWFIIKLLLNIYFYLWTIEHVQYIKKIHLQTKSNWLQSAVTNWCISSNSVNICTLCNVKFKIVQVIHDFNCYWHFDERNEFYCEYAYSKTSRNGNTSFAHNNMYCTVYNVHAYQKFYETETVYFVDLMTLMASPLRSTQNVLG